MDATASDPPTAFLRNVAYAATPDDIAEFFSSLGGAISDIRIPTDGGQPRGMAYVEFQTPQALEQALTLSGGNLCGRQVYVEVARSRKAGGAPSAGGSRSGGFAASSHQQQQQQGNMGGAQRQPDRFTAYVSALPQDTTESDLEDIFNGLAIADVRIPRDKETNEMKGIAFVEFKSQQDLENAVSRNGTLLREAAVSIAISEKKNRQPRQQGPYNRTQDADAFAAFGSTRNRRAPGAEGTASGAGAPSGNGASFEQEQAEDSGKQRPRLELKKRSVDAPLGTKASSSKSSPFGNAKPVDTSSVYLKAKAAAEASAPPKTGA